MCNLYANTMPADAMRDLFDTVVEDLGNQPPQPAIFPRHSAPIVRPTATGREAVRAHWGFLMPQVSKKTGKPILPRAVNNARDDKIRTSPFWRASFEERRCLVPATSFCEAKGRQPATYFWFGLKGGDPRAPFAFAGLWRRFRGTYRDAVVDIKTYTVVTTTPNDLVRDVHPDRMPVILAPEDYETWLSAVPDAAARLLRPYPGDEMEILLSGLDAKADAA